MINEKIIPEPIVNEMTAYLYMNNMTMKTKDLSAVCHIPVSVFPTQVIKRVIKIQKSLFNKVEFYQVAFNRIIDRMSRDKDFLYTCLSK